MSTVIPTKHPITPFTNPIKLLLSISISQPPSPILLSHQDQRQLFLPKTKTASEEFLSIKTESPTCGPSNLKWKLNLRVAKKRRSPPSFPESALSPLPALLDSPLPTFPTPTNFKWIIFSCRVIICIICHERRLCSDMTCMISCMLHYTITTAAFHTMISMTILLCINPKYIYHQLKY